MWFIGPAPAPDGRRSPARSAIERDRAHGSAPRLRRFRRRSTSVFCPTTIGLRHRQQLSRQSTSRSRIHATLRWTQADIERPRAKQHWAFELQAVRG